MRRFSRIFAWTTLFFVAGAVLFFTKAAALPYKVAWPVLLLSLATFLSRRRELLPFGFAFLFSAAGELSKFPEVRRDLALLVDKSVTFSSLRDAAFAAERKLLKSVSLFDVYEGDKLPEGKKSYALSFVLEDKSQTLTDKAIERVMNNLQAQFERQAGAVVR